MTSPNSTFTEIVTTTLRNHRAELADNVSDHNGLYTYLKKKGKIRKESGGYEIIAPLDYSENSTYQRFSGFDTLDIAASDVMTAAKYDWVNAAVHVVASGSDIRKNSGSERIIPFVKSKIKNAMRTAANNMSVDLYSDGALSNQIGGLGHIIQNAGTGTVGGINSSTYSFWQNKFREMSGTGTWSSTTIQGEMNNLYINCTRGTDKPDLIIASNDTYAAFLASLQTLQRYTNDAGSANLGFNAIKYLQADVIHDLNDNFSATAEKMYFVNTDYLELVVHRDADWVVQDEKVSTNQDGVIIPLVWMGNLTCSNRSLQGVLIDAA